MTGIHGIALIVAMVLNAAANLLLKVAMNRVAEGGGLLSGGTSGAVKTVFASPLLLVGLACFALNACFYMFALQSKSLHISLAYPIMVGGGFAIISVVGYLAMGEHLTTPQKIGVALVLGGAMLIATQVKETIPPV